MTGGADEAIDNVYCALLGHHVDEGSLVSARHDLLGSSFERIIRDLISSREYDHRFGETKVPQYSSDSSVEIACPQAVIIL
jgi:hypothetical protein